LLLAGGLVVFFVQILLRVLPFKRLVWLVERTALRSARLAPVHLAEETNRDIAWAITTAARYVVRSRCLTEALAAQWLFAWFGRPTLLRIGVAKANDKTFVAHAWLESEGCVILGEEALEAEAYAALPLPSPWTRS
jgi:hypothetical protein